VEADHDQVWQSIMNKTSNKTRFGELVRYLAPQIPGIKTLQLVKAIYLAELEYKIKFGESLTDEPIGRLAFLGQ